MNNEREVIKHESYGVLGFARCQTTPKSLYGSSIKHSNIIRLELKTSECERSLNKNYYFGRKRLFVVDMSMSQYAELISSMNCGDGIPVTIREINGKMIDDCPYVNETKEHYDDFKKDYKKLNAKALELIENLTERFKSSKPMGKKEKEEVLSTLLQFRYDLDENNSFRDEQFRKHMEKVTADAKAEVESFFDNKLRSIALSKIEMQGIKPPVELIDEVKDTNSSPKCKNK